jgi:hypothetical protein
MKLKLMRVLGYEKDNTLILGACVKTFSGNLKQCTKAAKEWLREHPAESAIIPPAWTWEK